MYIVIYSQKETCYRYLLEDFHNIFTDMLPVTTPKVSATLKAHKIETVRPVTVKAQPSTIEHTTTTSVPMETTTKAVTSSDKPSWYSVTKQDDKNVVGDYSKSGMVINP